MVWWAETAWSIVADLPVPMAHTGSYAMVTAANASPVKPDRLSCSCCVSTVSVVPVSRSTSVSPIQRIGRSPWVSAVRIFLWIYRSARKKSSPFRMPQNHIAATEVFEHRCGDFSRVSAAIFQNIFWAPELNWRRRPKRGADRFQCSKWGSNDQFDG